MSGETVFTFAEASANLRADPASRWSNIIGEFDTGVLPAVRPSFQLAPGEEIFTIGSCFARSIEAQLARLGFRIPMMGFSLPPGEWHGLPNQALNKFTPPSFRQALEWTAAIYERDGKVRWEDCEPVVFDCNDGSYFDQELAAQSPVSRERFLERRQQIYDVTRTAFSAGCVIMTPGLIEGWRDRQTGLFISGSALKNKKTMAARDRFELVVLDYDRCLRDLLSSVDLIRSHNLDCKILITTSPVPLAATFSGQDVRVANTYSKSILRAVCGALTAARPAIDYFPSYESVTLSETASVWQADRIHVRDAFVDRIVTRLVETYVTPIERPEDGEVHLASADDRLAQGDAQGAREMLQGLPPQDLALAPVRFRLARAVFASDPGQGADMGLEICDLPDATPRFILWTNQALTSLDAPFAQREGLLRAGTGRFPNNSGIRLALADLLERSGRAAEAVVERSTRTRAPG